MKKIAAALTVVLLCGACQERAPLTLAPLEELASSYDPASGLPEVSDEVRRVLLHHPKNQNYQVNVTLSILRLYEWQMEHYHQSYEIRGGIFGFGNNPLLDAFLSFADVHRSDFMGADIAYEWVLGKPELLKQPAIARLVSCIGSHRKNLAEGRLETSPCKR